MLPQTGEESTTWMVVLGAVILFTVGAYIFKKREEA